MAAPELRTHRITVPRTARYETLGEPTSNTREVWILCHGYGQLASEFLASARALEHPERLLVAPEALSRFYHDDHESVGASWMTRVERDHEMDDYIRYLDLLHDQLFELVERTSVRLVALGFSQGVATATRWAIRGREVDHLVLWAAALPPEIGDASSIATLKKTRMTLVSGTRDALFTESARDRERSRLRELGIAFADWSFDGGHRLDDDTLRKIAAS